MFVTGLLPRFSPFCFLTRDGSLEKSHCTIRLSYFERQDILFRALRIHQARVEIRVTRTMAEVFFKHFRIASHKRLFGKEGQTATTFDHLHPKHQQFLTILSKFSCQKYDNYTYLLLIGDISSFKKSSIIVVGSPFFW